MSFGRLAPDCSVHQTFLTTTWLLALNGSPSTPFTYHPIFQSLGVSCFAYGEVQFQDLHPTETQSRHAGILTLQPTSHPRSKAKGLVRHQLSMGSGLLCIILGTSAIIANKSIHYSDHFVSTHAVNKLWEMHNVKRPKLCYRNLASWYSSGYYSRVLSG